MDIRKPRTTISCRHLPAPNSTPKDTKETQRACPTVYHDHRIASSTLKPSSLSLVDHSATRYLLQTPLREKEPDTLDSPHHRNPQKPVILSHTTLLYKFHQKPQQFNIAAAADTLIHAQKPEKKRKLVQKYKRNSTTYCQRVELQQTVGIR
jgi:hypothetical protein